MSLEDLGLKSEEPEKYKVLTSFYEGKNINFKTDLTETEICAVVLIEFLDDFFKKEWKVDLKLKMLTNLRKELNVSRKRKGREEMVAVLKNPEEEGKKLNAFRKALGI